MAVRKKLVELLYEADRNCNNKQCETCKHQSKKFFCKIHFYIDHLIAHGVTVQDNTEITYELLKQLRNAPLMVLHEEPTIEVVQEWISVKDRLPDDNERVIAYRPNEPETSAYKYCVVWGWSVKTSLKHRSITHWCAMPQPPKGE